MLAAVAQCPIDGEAELPRDLVRHLELAEIENNGRLVNRADRGRDGCIIDIAAPTSRTAGEFDDRKAHRLVLRADVRFPPRRQCQRWGEPPKEWVQSEPHDADIIRQLWSVRVRQPQLVSARCAVA